jgi:hypothetical protein
MMPDRWPRRFTGITRDVSWLCRSSSARNMLQFLVIDKPPKATSKDLLRRACERDGQARDLVHPPLPNLVRSSIGLRLVGVAL